MKYIYILFIISFMSCKTSDTNQFIKNITDSKKELNANECPENFTCTIEVLKNKNLIVAKNDIGKIYPKIIDGKKIVISCLYKLNNKDNLTDGNNSEALLFVIDENTQNSLENNGLKNINLMFQKNCYCKDIFGYYEVTQGEFSLKSNKKTSEIDIEFTIPKVGNQQVLKKIHLKLK